jgi:plasmid segregation protein ParM
MDQLNIDKIPSVIETNSRDLRFVANDFINGIKISDDGKLYIVGQLALNEGISPHKNINGEPEEKDYQLLVKAALLLAVQRKGNPLIVTMGFPFSTFQLYKDKVRDIFKTVHTIEFDTAPYSGGGLKSVTAEVEQLAIMPEAISCALALRKHEKKTGNFFIISLGFGTCESIFSTEAGLVQRSSLSTFGIRYAVKLLEAELMKNFYLDLKNEHQLDAAFSNGFVFLNRKRVDITELRTNALRQYYNDVISPGLRKVFDDNDFARADAMYLAGGGALFDTLVEEFNKEFEGVIDVQVAENAPHLAAIGYCYNSLVLSNGDMGRAIGIDVGNSSTIVCSFNSEYNLI